jgi:hypothetical protein
VEHSTVVEEDAKSEYGLILSEESARLIDYHKMIAYRFGTWTDPQ